MQGKPKTCFWSLHGGGSFLDNVNRKLIINYSGTRRRSTTLSCCATRRCSWTRCCGWTWCSWRLRELCHASFGVAEGFLFGLPSAAAAAAAAAGRAAPAGRLDAPCSMAERLLWRRRRQLDLAADRLVGIQGLVAADGVAVTAVPAAAASDLHSGLIEGLSCYELL